MLRKMKFSLVLLLLALVALSAFSTLIAPQADARALTPNCSGSYWQIDHESNFQYKGLTLSGGSATYTWDLTLSSLRVCGTGQYEGRTADAVCLSVPAGTGWGNLSLYNEWGVDGNVLNYNTVVFPVSQTHYSVKCLYSGSWLTPSGHNAALLGFAQSFDGQYVAGQQALWDFNVH